MNIQPLGSPLTARPEERALPAVEQHNAQAARTPAKPATQGAAEPSRDEVRDALRKINESMTMSPQSLEFAIDEDSKEIVVKILDRATREVVRQIPSVEALEIAKSIDRMRGLLISQTA